MATQFPSALNIKEDDVKKLLACNAHIGSRTLEPGMARYMWKRRGDGVFIMNLQKTWEKIVLAARIIVAVENPADVVVISARPYGQRAILKFAKYTGAQAIAGRYTPGTFTNQIQENFVEPRLLILTDPRTDHQAVRESAYVNVPTIAFCHTDTPLNNIDVVIPCNNKAKQSIGLMWWLLCREVLYLRNNLIRGQPWDVMVDLFLYRDPEEQEKDEQAAALAGGAEEPARFEEPAAEWGGAATGGEWGGATTGGEWGGPAETAPSWDTPAQASWEGQDR